LFVKQNSTLIPIKVHPSSRKIGWDSIPSTEI
jgi:hypothetical protein